MKFDDFKTYIDAVKSADSFMDKAHKLGIDLIDSPVYDAVGVLTTGLFTAEYGKDGADWVSWYLYELPMMMEYDKDKPKNKEGKEGYAWDKDGNVLEVTTTKGLWEYLEKEYRPKKE